MIWFTWRQFRTPAWVALGLLAVSAVALLVTGHQLADLYSASRLAGCHADCAGAADKFLAAARTGTIKVAYNAGMALLYVLPALIGAFWGAPLLARELESGTHRLAWTQSVTRTRWLATKLLGVGGAALATSGLVSLGVTWWAHHLDHAADDRISPLVYGARGIVPIGYAAFGFAVGVTAGLLIRRSIPAMAVTLGVYIAAVAAMPLWVRAHLAPVVHSSVPLDLDRLNGIEIRNGSQILITGDGGVPGAWILRNDTVLPSGKVFTGPPDLTACGDNTTFKQCTDWLRTLDLRQSLAYQPASHFWALQWAETGIFLAVAAALTVFCFWWTRRKLT
jgi:hypothetical protein